MSDDFKDIVKANAQDYIVREVIIAKDLGTAPRSQIRDSLGLSDLPEKPPKPKRYNDKEDNQLPLL